MLFKWIVGLWLCVPAVALADVVGNPPSTCPAGSVPDSNHAGGYCAVTQCLTAGTCEEGAKCEEQGVCVVTRTGESLEGSFTFDDVVGICELPSDCDSDARCLIEDRCVLKSGCGCQSMSWAAANSMAGLLVLIGLVARRRDAVG